MDAAGRLSGESRRDAQPRHGDRAERVSVVAALRERLRAALPYLVAAGLFGFGLCALDRLLAEVNVHDILAQLRATPATTLLLAILTTSCGYLALAGYDWSALHDIGKPLPLPVVLTGGLMAYAFGNTIGLSVLSGGAIRWRIYSRLGLDVADIAAVSTFAATSGGTAATVVGLAALAAQPTALQAVLPASPALVRSVAVAAIAMIVLPLVVAAWLKRELRIGRLRIAAPRLPTLGGQVLFSLADIGFSALTLHLLLPPSGLPFLAFLALFTAATVAGLLSHVPGGVGVFETVMLSAMPVGTPLDRVAAALLLFRFVYYLLPFLVALVVLAAHETWRAAAGRLAAEAPGRASARLAPVFDSARPLAPTVLGVLVLGSGVWMSIASVLPLAGGAAEVTEFVFPLAFVEGSALLSSAIGAALIVLSFGVFRRSRGAFWLSVAALLAGIGLSLAQGLDIDRAGVLLLALLLLLPFRDGFDRESTLTHAVLTPGWLVLMAATLGGLAFVVSVAHRDVAHAQELWWQFAADAQAPRALRALFTLGLLLGLLSLFLLLRAPRPRPVRADDPELARAAAIIRASPSPPAQLVFGRDTSFVFSPDGRAFVPFLATDHGWIAPCGPIGPRRSADEAAFAFVAAARRAGRRPEFLALRREQVPLMLDLGLFPQRSGTFLSVELSAEVADAPLADDCPERSARAEDAELAFALVGPPPREDLRSTVAAFAEATTADARWLAEWPVAVLRRRGESDRGGRPRRGAAFPAALPLDFGRAAAACHGAGPGHGARPARPRRGDAGARRT